MEAIGGDDASLAPNATETDRGWFFQWEEVLVGCKGLVVNKETGHVFALGSAFSVERDLRMYDRGMDAEQHDLVITAVNDLDKTLGLLSRIDPAVVEPSFEHGTVWRIPRSLTEAEMRTRLQTLPALFADVRLYFTFEAIEEARSTGCCQFELFPRRP